MQRGDEPGVRRNVDALRTQQDVIRNQISAAEAVTLGLANRAVPKAELMAEAMKRISEETSVSSLFD